MTPFLTNLKIVSNSYELPTPANNDAPQAADAFPSATEHKIISWLFRATRDMGKKSNKKDSHKQNGAKLAPVTEDRRTKATAPAEAAVPLAYDNRDSLHKGQRFLAFRAKEPMDDWQTVTSLCGHGPEDFRDAGVSLPLSTAEIDHFRRNHRETDHLIARDFLTIKSNLPSPLAELYGLYRHRARLDTESAFFVAQATSSTRVSQLMADLLAIGGFANGHECIAHISQTYSVPAAFDTSDLIDRANIEALRRLALPVEHPAHLLKLSPDEVSVLAANIVERHLLSGADFLDKAHKLAEARQDVNRLPPLARFSASLKENDLPHDQAWVARIAEAYTRIFQIAKADV